MDITESDHQITSAASSKPISSSRTHPNIIITGTPGVGKSTTARDVASECSFMKHLNISKLVVENKLHDGPDPDFQGTFVLNEDKILDHIDKDIAQGGCIIDFHTPGMFQENDIDHVFVLRCSNDILYPRLEKRYFFCSTDLLEITHKTKYLKTSRRKYLVRFS